MSLGVNFLRNLANYKRSTCAVTSPLFYSELLKVDDVLPRLTLGSLRTFHFLNISSVSPNRMLTMTCNLTSQYEHDYPTIKYHLIFRRPAVQTTEREDFVVSVNLQPNSVCNKIISQISLVISHDDCTFQFVTKAVRSTNPSTNEILWTAENIWGEMSETNKGRINLSTRSTPVFKDDECVKQTLWGCKDRYGVVYPIW